MTLNYKSFGHGPPLIILHGLFGMLDNWQSIAKQLAGNYSVYTVDLRNHGRSPHSEEFDYCVMAADVIEFMEAQSIYSSYVLGHSMGGKVAMQMAMEYQDYVQKLVVVDIGPKAYAPGHTMIFEALNSIDLTQINRRSTVEAVLTQQIDNSSVVRFLLKNLMRTPDRSYKWKLNLDVIRSQYHAVNEEIVSNEPFEGPTLFIRGGMSPYIEMDDMPGILSLFPNAVLETIKGAGHWVHAEKPEALLKVVRSFLK